MATLDINAVRAFVVIAELKSFTRAANELGSTQGALSVKLKRLENVLGQKLIERTPRQVRLSTFGEIFIDAARDFLKAHDHAISIKLISKRKFNLGISCYVMGPEVPEILSKLKSLDHALLIEVKVDSSHILMDKFNNGQLDAVIVRNDDDRRDGTVLCPERFGWFAAADFEYNDSQPLHLANLSPDCGIRDITTQLLRRASINWTEVFIGAGIPAVIAAISSGLAVGMLPHRLAPEHLVEVSHRYALPSLPSLSIVLHSSLSDQKSRATMHSIARVYREYHRRLSGTELELDGSSD